MQSSGDVPGTRIIRFLVRLHAFEMGTPILSLATASAREITESACETTESADDETAEALESVFDAAASQHGQVSGHALHSDTVHKAWELGFPGSSSLPCNHFSIFSSPFESIKTLEYRLSALRLPSPVPQMIFAASVSPCKYNRRTAMTYGF